MRLLDPIRRAFRWHRRGVAALLAAVAVLSGVTAVSSRASSGVPVVVAARDIAAGAIVQGADLAVATVPAELIPDQAFTTPDAIIGRSAVVELPTRSVVTSAVLIGADGQVPDGQVAVPVRFGEAATVALLRVGDHIDVIGPTNGSDYGVVAADVRVMAIPGTASGGLLNSSQTPLVLLAVSPAQASEIAAAAAVSSLSYALH